MAQGGGRGWFHRKRHQPEADSQNGTPHAASGSSADGSAALNPAPAGQPAPRPGPMEPRGGRHVARSIDARAANRLPRYCAPPAPSSAPSEESLQFSRTGDAEPDPVRPADGSRQRRRRVGHAASGRIMATDRGLRVPARRRSSSGGEYTHAGRRSQLAAADATDAVPPRAGRQRIHRIRRRHSCCPSGHQHRLGCRDCRRAG